MALTPEIFYFSISCYFCILELLWRAQPSEMDGPRPSPKLFFFQFHVIFCISGPQELFSYKFTFNIISHFMLMNFNLLVAKDSGGVGGGIIFNGKGNVSKVRRPYNVLTPIQLQHGTKVKHTWIHQKCRLHMMDREIHASTN